MEITKYFKKYLKKEISEKEEGALSSFLNQILEWNKKINLTAIRKPEDIILKHFIDSYSLLSYIPENAKKLIDIGSGAGFPGIPLAIAKEEIEVCLVESINKKCAFLENQKEVLKLPNLEVVNARAEELGRNPDYREKYDVATARAVSRLSSIIELTFPLLKLGGILIAQKDTEKENLDKAQNALEELSGEIKEIIEVKIEGISERKIIIIKKKKNTRDIYPRKNGIPQKKPL